MPPNLASATGRSAKPAATQALASDWPAPEPRLIVSAVMERARMSIHDLADRIDTDAAFRLVTQPTVSGFFIALGKELAGTAPAPAPSAPAETRQAQALAFKQSMKAAAGGLLCAEDVRQLRGSNTPQAVYKAVKDRRLLAVKDNGNVLLPAIQFDGDGKVKPWVRDLARATPTTDGWTLLQWLLGTPAGLAGSRPIDMLDAGGADCARALRLATSLEE
jgi:hypothetical protein